MKLASQSIDEVPMGHNIDSNRSVLSVSEASTLSGFTRSNINHLINQGYIDAVKVGNAWLVYEDSLCRYMAAPRKPGPRPRREGDPSAVSSVPEPGGKVGKTPRNSG